jgi:hypothetical protein
MKPLAFISFDNGVCRRLRTNAPEAQRAEALQACDAVQLGANLLDESLRVVGQVRRAGSARGFVLAVDGEEPRTA